MSRRRDASSCRVACSPAVNECGERGKWLDLTLRSAIVGWPREIALPGLPQIRACGTPALGSSRRRFAVRWHALIAIHRAYVEAEPRPLVPAAFPPGGSTPRRSPSLHRVPMGEFPDFSSTMQALRLPAVLLVRLRFLRHPIPHPASPGASPRTARTTTARRSGDLIDRLPTVPAVLRRRRQDLPGSQGTPVRACPGLRPRRNFGARPFQHLRGARRPLATCGLPLPSERRPPRVAKFRSSMTRPARSLSTLRSAPHDAPRKTRFRRAGHPHGQGCPAGFLARFQFSLSLHLLRA